MQMGMIGLGRMGANMMRRLSRGGHECSGYDLSAQNVEQLVQEGLFATTSLSEFIKRLATPRVVWLMVPAGEPTEQTIQALREHLSAGDIIVEGGNTFYKDDVRRAQALQELDIHYVDVGTSGGVWGLERGYCLMIGGEEEVVNHLKPLFRTLSPGPGDTPRTPGRDHAHAAPQERDVQGAAASGAGMSGTAEEGFVHCGPSGAGHFVKMIHNGIEYGLMQAYAEGFDILRHAADPVREEHLRYTFNLADIAEVWRRGSVIGSWLLDLIAGALVADPELSRYTGYVQDSGEGRWTIQTALEQAVPAEVLSAALYARFRSRQDHTFAEKVLSALREQFGGHVEKTGHPLKEDQHR